MSVNLSYEPKDLLSRIAKGDEPAFRQLFNDYWRKIYSITLLYAKVPEVAEDATQEVFVQLWNKRAGLTAISAFDGYLFTMAKHIAFNMIRRRIFSGDADDYLAEYFSDNDPGPAGRLEMKEMNQVLEDGIGRLPPQQQKVFRLSRFQGLSHAEIASEMGLSKRTVKNYMISAIQSLRDHLGKQSGFSPVVLLFFLEMMDN